MSPNGQLDLDAFLADHPVFSLEQLAVARGGSRDHKAAHNQLKHHVITGRVKSVARGLYAAVPPGLDPEGFQPDRYLVGAATRPQGVFAYHAALELLGSAHSVWGECALHCEKPRQSIELASATVVFLPTPSPVQRSQAEQLGVRRVPHETEHVQVTGPERTLVEGFRQPHRVGGLEELWLSAAGFPILDFALLQEVLEVYQQRSLWAAVGWFVASQEERWDPPSEFLALCRENRPRQNQYLLRNRRGGRTLSEWNLIVPENLLRAFEGHASHP